MNPLITLFLPATVVPLLLIIPAMIASRRKPEPDSRFLPLVHLPAIIVWHQLIVRGYGAQSLGNLGEIYLLGLAAIGGAYLKVFLVDRSTSKHTLTSLLLMIALCLLAVALRTFMPAFREGN